MAQLWSFMLLVTVSNLTMPILLSLMASNYLNEILHSITSHLLLLLKFYLIPIQSFALTATGEIYSSRDMIREEA